MQINRSTIATLALCALLSACNRQADTPAAASPAAGVSTATKAPAQAAARRASACELVTPGEMSAILGGPVGAAPGSNERPPTSTECEYAATSGPSPYAEIEVDWDQGELQSFTAAAGLATGAAPAGAVDPLKGLGERAYTVTSFQVFISTGGHLMIIRFLPGATDVIPKARRIFETAKARM